MALRHRTVARFVRSISGSGLSLVRRCNGPATVSGCRRLQLAATRYLPDGTHEQQMKGDSWNPAIVHQTGAPPVVFLHGLFGNRANFRTISRQLAEETQRDVYGLDLRNHGDSPWDNHMSFEAMADDVAETLHRLVQSPGGVILVGHSLGGKTAMVTALQNPELVRRLVVVDIAPIRYAAMRQSRSVAQAMQGVPLSGPGALRTRQEVDEHLRPLIPEDGIRQFVLTNFVSGSRHREATWRCNVKALTAEMPSLATFPTFEATADFPHPAHFLYGRRSDYVVERDVKPALQRLFPQHTLQGFDTGHWVHAEQPGPFREAIADLVAQDHAAAASA